MQQYIEGTHFRAVLMGELFIEHSASVDQIAIHTEAGSFFVEPGILDMQSLSMQPARPVMKRESLQTSIDGRVSEADRDIQIVLENWGGNREMLKSLLAQVSRTLTGAVAMIQQRGR